MEPSRPSRTWLSFFPRLIILLVLRSRCAAVCAGTLRPFRMKCAWLGNSFERLRECLLEISDQVFGSLEANREPNRVWGDPGKRLFLIGELAVRCLGCIDNQRASIAHIGLEAEESNRIDELVVLLRGAAESEREHGSGASREVLLGQLTVLAALGSRVVHPSDLFVRLQVLDEGLGRRYLFGDAF